MTTSLARLLIDVVFTTLVQRHDMVKQRHNVKTTSIQHTTLLGCHVSTGYDYV